MSLRKIGWWALVAVLLWWAITQPHAAAAAVRHLGTIASTAASGLSKFASNL